jgi:hypothetical protein
MNLDCINEILQRLADAEAQLERDRDALIAISLSSQNTMGGNSTDLGRIARAALEEVKGE